MTDVEPGTRRSIDQRIAQWPPPVLVGAGAALLAAGTVGVLTGGAGPLAGPVEMTAVLALTFTPLGVFVMRRLPGHALGRLMAVVGVSAAVAALAASWSELLVAAWLSQWAWWPPVAVIPVLLLLVPDGRLPSPRWRPLLIVLVAAGALTTVTLALAALASPRTLLSLGLVAPSPPVRALVAVAAAGLGVLVLATGGVLVALGLRWRGAGTLERRQLLCLAPAALLLVVGVVLDIADVPLGWLPAVVALPFGLTVAVLRYQLHDLDLYVHRGSVWIVLTGSAALIYVGVVTVLGATVTRPGDPIASVLGAAAVAALLQPAQRVAQRGVNRLLYGRRDEPHAVLATLGRNLEDTRDPLAMLPEIAATVVDALRVPYAAVQTTGDDGATSTAAEHGRWSGPPESFPMVAHGRPVGALLVAPRRAGTRFSGAEARLLRDLAGQAALAADACRSAIALQGARDRLVLAREEERRRLRRDLHDGVASALVGTRMLTEVVRRSVPADGPAPDLLDGLAADLDACASEVRQLIDGLRPAALDDGLATALTGLVDRTAGPGPAVTLSVADDLTELPAAVEVAAYRVVAEALTNVVKHAHAGTAAVRVSRDARHLEVRVDDDGVGIGDPGDSGVGLSSIRERAAELGGRVEISSGPGGTHLLLLLPLQA